MSPRRSKPPILLLGFEPFGGDAINPSQDVLQALHGKGIAGHRIATAVLPCAFAEALHQTALALERERPVIALGLGLAATRARLSLERVAINLIDARIPDNAGAQPIDVAVIAGAPSAYFASLPVKAMLRAMLDAGVPAELSLSGGSYVCNAVAFALQHLAVSLYPNLRTGFLHLPCSPELAVHHPGASCLHLETMRRGVDAALRAALKNPDDCRDIGGAIC